MMSDIKPDYRKLYNLEHEKALMYELEIGKMAQKVEQERAQCEFEIQSSQRQQQIAHDQEVADLQRRCKKHEDTIALLQEMLSKAEVGAGTEAEIETEDRVRKTELNSSGRMPSDLSLTVVRSGDVFVAAGRGTAADAGNSLEEAERAAPQEAPEEAVKEVTKEGELARLQVEELKCKLNEAENARQEQTNLLQSERVWFCQALQEKTLQIAQLEKEVKALRDEIKANEAQHQAALDASRAEVYMAEDQKQTLRRQLEKKIQYLKKALEEQ